MVLVKSEIKKKIGILGGTFDPAHNGHIKISIEAKKRYGMHKIIWAITKKNPYKSKSILSLKERIKYAKKINYKNKFIKVKFYENIIKSNRTIDLIKYIKKNNKSSRIYFIMGADNLINFHKWKKWKKIPELAKIVVFARPQYSIKALNSIASKKLKKKDWIYINSKKLNISSSLIRKF